MPPRGWRGTARSGPVRFVARPRPRPPIDSPVPSALPPAIAAGTLAGLLLAAQPGINGALGKRLAHPLHASLTSFSVGLTCSVVACLVLARSLPRPRDYAGAAWWELTGGMIGATLVTLSLLFAPKVGGGTWLGILVLAQLAGGVLLDHYGLAGYDVRPATAARLAGVALMAAGVVLVVKG